MRMGIFVCLFLLLFSLGCIFGSGAESLAEELSVMRGKFVKGGLLVPADEDGREAYRQALITYRIRVNALSGGGKEVLQAYLDGSLSLVDMVSDTDEAFSLLENVNPDFAECSPGSPTAKATTFMEDARESAQSAHSQFQTVQKSPTLTNELGADYVLNAAQTTAAISTVHAERVNELKTACGFSV